MASFPRRPSAAGETNRDVEFWKRMTEEADRRRRLRTPVHLEARIMEALPRTAPQIITPWWRREFVVTPTVAVSTMVGVMVATAVVTALLFQAVR